MSRKVVLPVRNESTEGFELIEVFEQDLTTEDKKYLEKKAKLQSEPGNEEKLEKLLRDYLKKQPEPEESAE